MSDKPRSKTMQFCVVVLSLLMALGIPFATGELSADFVRGDANVTGAPPDIADAICILQGLFGGGCPLTCRDAADANDDGLLNIADAIFLLNFLFLGGPMPPPPGPFACGPDLTPDALPPGVYPLCIPAACP